MREYRNRDSKTNDEESDPCIAAEVRMKKSAISSRTRRNLVALLIVLAVIASLSVLLFLILPRSKETSEGVRYSGYDTFEVPVETTTLVTVAPAAILSSKEGDVVISKASELSQETASFRQSESHDHSSPVEEKLSHDELPVLVPARFEVVDLTTSTSRSIVPNIIPTQTSRKFPGVETTETSTKAGAATSVPGNTVVPLTAKSTTKSTTVEVRTVPVPNTVAASHKENARTLSTVIQNPVERVTAAPVVRPVAVKSTVTGSAVKTTVATSEKPSVATTPVAKIAEVDPVTLPALKATTSEKRATTIAARIDASFEGHKTPSSTVGIQPKSTAGSPVSSGLHSFTTGLPGDSTGDKGIALEVPDRTSTGEAKNCEEFFARGERENGIYSLSQPKPGKFEAVCDMTTTVGGWNVIQRRLDGSVEFYNRTWDEYEHGFGQLNTSFWLGLEKIYALVNEGKGKSLTLRIEIEGDRCSDRLKCSPSPDGYWFGEWDFKLASAKENYALTLTPAKSGNLTEHTVGDKFYTMNNGRQFTTVDRDNDRLRSKNCAEYRKFGGWWHNDCGYVALNGRYAEAKGGMKGLFWYYHSVSTGPKEIKKTVSYYINPRATEMKIRLNV